MVHLITTRDALNDKPTVGHDDHSLVQVPWEAWFPHIPANEDEELFEFAAKVDAQGTMMSVLWVPSRS